jgi:hypothetical protein
VRFRAFPTHSDTNGKEIIMPKTVTLNFLEKHDACREAVVWVKTQKKKDHKSLFKALIIEEKDLSWGIWYLTRTFNKTQNIKLAIYTANQVLHIYEKKYPDDKRPRKAIRAARKYLKNPDSENYAAAYAAYAVADVADAAHAADAADVADVAHAAYAAAHAAKKELQLKIIRYGIKLLERTP